MVIESVLQLARECTGRVYIYGRDGGRSEREMYIEGAAGSFKRCGRELANGGYSMGMQMQARKRDGAKV